MATTVEEDLGQLEKDVRQFKIEYEQYFGGGRSRPPSDTEWRIELILKRYAERTAELSFGDRFRYNGLAQTYAKYREIFRKRLQQKEEGFVQRHFGAAARKVEAERHKAQAAREVPGRAPIYAVTCSDPGQENDKVEELFQALLTAKKQAGEDAGPMNLHEFREFVRLKTRQIREESGCEKVEYVVAQERGQVRLKARVKS